MMAEVSTRRTSQEITPETATKTQRHRRRHSETATETETHRTHSGGHAFIKERMRTENAIYAGEMSGHYYFRDFSYCDSGMIPWLLLIDIMAKKGQSLSGLINECRSMFPCSGEINLEVEDIHGSLEKVKNHFLN